jgi:secreted trypsin-like serine protease
MKGWGELWRRLAATVLGAAAIAALALAPAAGAAEPGAAASIIGGHAVTIAEFPSLPFIEAREGKHGFACTGSVVAPRVVLTAAHCVEDIEKGKMTPAGNYAIATGVANPSQAGIGNVFHIAATHVFPGFDPGIIRGDAAILILASPTTAPPIPLAGAADAPLYAGGAEVQLAGWGLTSARARKQPENLQATSMLVQTPSFCQSKTKSFYKPYSPTAQVCMLAADRASGGCFGDSGGPAIGHRADGTPVQLGITSTGGFSCSTKLPNVLTRVDYVSTWVNEWIAATELGAAPPVVDPATLLPAMIREGAEQLAVFSLIDAFGPRFEGAREVAGRCRKASRIRFRCQVAWITGKNIYAGDVSPFYVERQQAVAWDSHFRIEWASVKCLRGNSRHCAIHRKRG